LIVLLIEKTLNDIKISRLIINNQDGRVIHIPSCQADGRIGLEMA
jgi:hypothetical protein